MNPSFLLTYYLSGSPPFAKAAWHLQCYIIDRYFVWEKTRRNRKPPLLDSADCCYSWRSDLGEFVVHWISPTHLDNASLHKAFHHQKSLKIALFWKKLVHPKGSVIKHRLKSN